MIAQLRGTAIHVFRNAVGAEATPCAVYMNREHGLIVGQAARDHCESDPGNAFMEFKRDMGSNTSYCFTRNGRRVKPEELSAEVLKSLCGDAKRATGQTVNAAVITVPADFDLPQCKATKEAAQLAGIKHALLLTEPVAAAQAYSFDTHDHKTFWLVYDFGGGAFDAAIIQVRDSLIKVAGHKGDNQLGGKSIDWAIVEELFIPVVNELSRLTDFKRGNIKWRGAFAKLKMEAEKAKILLSATATTSVEIRVDFLCNDEWGQPIEFDYVLKRSDFERVASPFIRRTINCCKEVLAAQHLNPSDVGKVILVGEGTMHPLIRELLSEPNTGLGIPLEFSVDPMTVTVRGAAVFAASQRILPDDEVGASVSTGPFAALLDYAPVGPDPDPIVAGILTAGEGAAQDFSGYTVEFINPGVRPAWRSGKVGIGSKGNFVTNVSAEKGRENRFEIELCDASGALQPVTPNSFTIVVKGAGVIVDPAHSHSLGVALANNELLVVYQKETPLPFRKRIDLRTEVSLKKGQSGRSIRFPLVEGDSRRADRNRIVGTLVIPAEHIMCDLPAGSEIELTIEIDLCTQIRTKAYIPILDQEFEDVMQLISGSPDVKDLVVQLENAKDRLKHLRQKADSTGNAGPVLSYPRFPFWMTAQAALQRIDSECMASEAEKLVGSATSEADAARQCQYILNRLNSSLDDVEDALEWPALVERAEKKLTFASDLVGNDKYANAEDRRIFEILERETREAIEQHVPDLLGRRFEALSALIVDIVHRSPDACTYSLIRKPQQPATDGLSRIVGRVRGPQESSFQSLVLEFTNEDTQPEWNSGPIPVSANGDFSVTAKVQLGAATNELHVSIRDNKGHHLKLVPDYLVLRIGKDS